MRLLTLLVGIALFSSNAFANNYAKVVHWSAIDSKVIRETKVVQLRGNAHLSRDNEDLLADEIDFNQETQIVNARGRVRYQYGSYFVKAEAIDLDIENKTGVITNGNVTNGTFALRGSKMEQIGENRFLVNDYNYTTCLDCPNAWEMTGREADVTIDGYAIVKDFIFKIKETPIVWMPYMIVPAKSRRQTGLLFPRFGVNEVHGVYFVQPTFLAINRWSDMTAGVGYFSLRGARFEWEGRYALTERSFGIANLYFTRDKEVANLNYRYAGKVAITQELPFKFEAKLKGNEVSDSGYPITYSEDIKGRLDPVLASDFFISRNDPDVSTIVAFRRFRNLLFFDANNNFVSGFDTNTVQETPRVVVNTNNKFIFGSKVASGLEMRFNNFTRGAGPFDTFSSATGTNDIKVIREAKRFTAIPSLYTTLNPWPWLSLVPSVQYRAFFYNFSDATDYPSLARGYLLAQAEMSFQLEKMIPTSNPDVLYKHTFRPVFTYSVIPTTQESSAHPFIQQIEATGRPGQYFDYWDIVPMGTSQDLDSYFTPLGNSLTYGFTTQLFKLDKNIKGERRVARRLEGKLTQTFDIYEAKKFLDSGQTDNRVILSPLFAQLTYGDPKFTVNTEYTYYSYLDRYVPNNSQILTYHSPHRFSTSATWNMETAIHQGVLHFERSLAISYSFAKLISRYSSFSTDLRYSINDYIMPQISYVFDFMSNPTQILEWRYGALFQSPSRCWGLDLAVTRSIDRGFGFVSSFALNLTGETLADTSKR